MVKLFSKLFILFVVFIASFNVYGLDLRANQQGIKEATDFTLQDLSDKYVSLKDFQGKPVILFFWTTWCPYCRSEVKSLNEEYDKMKSLGIQLLAIDINEPKERVNDFINKNSITYPILLDSGGTVATKYGVVGVPTIVLISKDSKIVHFSNSLPSNYKELILD
jgi:peroxiredoxin